VSDSDLEADFPARIDAVTLAVADLERSLSFYRDGLGMKLVHNAEYVKGLAAGNIALDLIDQSVLASEMHISSLEGASKSTTLVIRVDRPDVDRIFAAMVEAGALVIAEPEDKPLGPRIAYLADPDGHVWEIGAFDG
jgi:uncharacterized protein